MHTIFSWSPSSVWGIIGPQNFFNGLYQRKEIETHLICGFWQVQVRLNSVSVIYSLILKDLEKYSKIQRNTARSRKRQRDAKGYWKIQRNTERKSLENPAGFYVLASIFGQGNIQKSWGGILRELRSPLVALGL